LFNFFFFLGGRCHDSITSHVTTRFT